MGLGEAMDAIDEAIDEDRHRIQEAFLQARAVHVVVAELRDATTKFAAFHSAHEGWAVLMEEVDELWEVVKLNQSTPERNARMRKEAIQVAAMAIRFLVDCTEED